MRLAIVLALSTVLLAGCATPHQGDQRRLDARAVNPDDAAAVGATIDAVYAVISGPAGTPRDFAYMRTLFTSDARLTAITPQGLRGGTLDDYIARSGPVLVQQGFTERGLVNRIEVYGALAQVWSSYIGRFTDREGKPGEVRGINSFQLVRQPNGRWLVQSILWQAATPGNPLPADMAGAR